MKRSSVQNWLVMGAVCLMGCEAPKPVVSTAMTASSPTTGEPTTTLRDAAKKISESVYLVAIAEERGPVVAPGGTAWVVGPGLVATNAHVAAAFDSLRPGQRLIVRSSAAYPVDHVVKKVTLHPGYASFQKVIAGWQPAKKVGDQWEMPFYVTACDVALMEVEDAGSLGPALPLATPEELQALGPLTSIALCGYPMELIAGGGVNAARPVPITRTGEVLAVTDFLLGRAPAKDSLLVHHSCVVTGGASGSPMIDGNGRVVAVLSAGNFFFLDGNRYPLGVGIAYAQRADLVRELLDNRAEAAQVARLEEWSQGLHQLVPVSAVLAATYEAAIRGRVQDWALAHGGQAKEIDKTTVTVSSANLGSEFGSLKVGPGKSLIVAHSLVPMTRFELTVRGAGGLALGAGKEEDRPLQIVELDLNEERTVTVGISGIAPEPVHVQSFVLE